MEITINVRPLPVEPGQFHYENMSSSYGVNSLYFTKEEKPHTIISGELHFARLPKTRWKETLLKMQECGINTVSTYIFWNYHEEIKGNFDFRDNKDIHQFLYLCREIKMPCILRIGPWCHGEVLLGGLPKRINKLSKKRTDDPEYLSHVRDFWERLYLEVKEYLDGETVLGIQLENEYNGSNEHIRTLRKIAEEIGYKTPFFTMTAWPSGKPDKDFLPMVGGYPDAPWSHKKAPLKPNNRFSISPSKIESEIGADLHRNNNENEISFTQVPFASCEIGPGIQVTQHRRPIIREKDGYGVSFAKFASGMNWIGYYMFCGGANPIGRLLQESKRSGYPNNYPIIDYDFQAPISRYGVCRPHADRLRLLHLFFTKFDPNISTKQAFFPDYTPYAPDNIAILRCSIRTDEDGRGYFFAGTYEKSMNYQDFQKVTVTITTKDDSFQLPTLTIKAGTMFFYPFRMFLGSVFFEYILAQPIAKIQKENELICYFVQCEGILPKCKVDGIEILLSLNDHGVLIKDQIRLIILPYQDATKFHLINEMPYFLEGTIYQDTSVLYQEIIQTTISNTNISMLQNIALTKTKRKYLPHNYYLFSNGRRGYYQLYLPPNILDHFFDILLEFEFSGLNLQVFSELTLINDFFNIDGTFIMHLRDYKEYIDQQQKIYIRTAPKTRFGISKVYSEHNIPLNDNSLKLTSVKEIQLRSIQTQPHL